MAGFASVVILDAPLRSLDRTFTYAIPDELGVSVGTIVRVPFHGRLRTGITVGLEDETTVVAKPIKATLGPGLSEDALALAAWLAESCLSSPSAALAALVPDRVKAEEAKETPTPEPLAPYGVPLPDALVAALGDGSDPVLYEAGLGEDRARLIAQLASDEVRAGGRVLVILPESDPTLRTAIAVRDACGGHAAWLGSDRSSRLRYRAWLGLRRGVLRVAVGGRGAVLAPLDAPTLVLIDDEASPNHREGRSPRYDAVRVGIHRARTAGGRCVVVGAPASIERRILADPRAQGWRHVSGTSSVRPVVRIVDAETLAPTAGTLRALRGASGRIVVLVHRGDRVGFVAERIGRILERPVLEVSAGLDADVLATARRPDGPGIIVGTPVLASDHHFDGVSDVVILDADAALVGPGYRTNEEMFATWWRVLDATRPAHVSIETQDRTHPVMEAIRTLDPAMLAKREARQRSELGYPPYHTLVRVSAAPDAMPAVRAAVEAVPGCEVVPPFPTGDGEMSMIMRAPTRVGLVRALGPIADALRADGVRARFEVDPLDLVESRWRS